MCSNESSLIWNEFIQYSETRTFWICNVHSSSRFYSISFRRVLNNCTVVKRRLAKRKGFFLIPHQPNKISKSGSCSQFRAPNVLRLFARQHQHGTAAEAFKLLIAAARRWCWDWWNSKARWITKTDDVLLPRERDLSSLLRRNTWSARPLWQTSTAAASSFLKNQGKAERISPIFSRLRSVVLNWLDFAFYFMG